MNKTLNVFGLTVQVNTLVFALWAAFLLAWIFAICGVAAPFITYSYAGVSILYKILFRVHMEICF